MEKLPRIRLTVYLGSGTSPEDRQLRSRLRFAAEQMRTHTWPGLLQHRSAEQNPLDAVRTAIAAADCVVLLVTPGYLQTRRPSSDLGIAIAYKKPIYLLLKDLREDGLPDHMRGLPTFAWRQLSQLIEHAREHSLNLSLPERKWLWQWYKGKRVPLEGVIREEPVLNDLAAGFHKAAHRKVAGEKLLSELFRMRKQGKLPAPLHKGTVW